MSVILDFPTHTIRYGLLLGFTCGGSLPSALRDMRALHSRLTKEFKFGTITIAVESENDAKILKAQGIESVVTPNRESLFALMSSQAQLYNSQTQPVDVFFALSTHGFAIKPDPNKVDGTDENIFLNGQAIYDEEIHKQFFAKLGSQVNLLGLCDTCASETMAGLPYESTDGKTWASVTRSEPAKDSATCYCISACSNRQSSMDDMDEDFGYNGGLSAAFLDFTHEKQIINVRELYSYIKSRLSLLNQQPVLSSTRNV